MTTTCPKCQHENTDDQRFCGDCGTQLTPSDSIPDVTKTIEAPAQELTMGTVFAKGYEIIGKLSELE